MATLILEKDIPATTFISSLSGSPQQWYRQLTYILNTDELNKGVQITFNTTEGLKIVRTNIVAVIENYVKISYGVIIPLSCVTAITAEDGILPAEDRNNVFQVVLFLFSSYCCQSYSCFLSCMKMIPLNRLRAYLWVKYYFCMNLFVNLQ